VWSGLAQEPSAPTLRVATRVVPPFVVDQGGVLSGFSIDLWNSIADRLKGKTNCRIAEDIGALLETVRSGNADLGISAISITSMREVEFDFSQPILNAGLQIMVRGAAEDVGSSPLRDRLSHLFSRTLLVWLAIALLFIVIPAHLVWWFERRDDEAIVPDDRIILVSSTLCSGPLERSRRRPTACRGTGLHV
jgi:polar amino acid transport system substrate-binding protein